MSAHPIAGWTRRVTAARRAALTALLTVAALALPETRVAAAVRPAAAAATAAEGVLDGSVARAARGWTASSAAGPVNPRRVSGVRGPFTATTAMEISRAGGTGVWAMALAPLRNPASFFTAGRTYRMQGWVRDLHGARRPIGMLLANGNYALRPADAAVYGEFTDTGWHLITRTFTATAAGRADTTAPAGW